MPSVPRPTRMSFFSIFKTWVTPNRVVHIRFGIVDDDRFCIGDGIHLKLIHVDAVDKDGFLACDVQAVQSLDGWNAVFIKKILPVGGVFRHMDVTAHTCIFGDAHASFNRFIGSGEGGMQPHHGCNLTIALANFLDETFVFGYPAAFSIAV